LNKGKKKERKAGHPTERKEGRAAHFPSDRKKEGGEKFTEKSARSFRGGGLIK